MKGVFKKHLAEILGIDDPELQEELIEEYNRTFNSSVAQMREASDAADFDRLRQLGHALKGCALNIGHTDAHEHAFFLEQCAKAADLAGCRRTVEGLAAIAARLEAMA